MKREGLDDDDGAENPIEDNKSPGLHLQCGRGGCVPSAYLELLKNGPVPDFRFEQVESKAKATPDYDGADKIISEMVTKLGNELFCRVVEWNIDGDTIARNFCIILGTMPMIEAFDGNLEEINMKMAAVIPVSEVPEPPDGAEYIVEHIEEGDPASEIKTVVLDAEMLNENSGDPMLKYADVDKCWLCYNIVKPISEIKSENECCMRFAVAGKTNVICSDKPTSECEGPMKAILAKIYGGCME